MTLNRETFRNPSHVYKVLSLMRAHVEYLSFFRQDSLEVFQYLHSLGNGCHA